MAQQAWLCCPRALSSVPNLALPQPENNDCFSVCGTVLSSSLAIHFVFFTGPKARGLPSKEMPWHFIYVLRSKIQGQRDGSAGYGTCCQDWQKFASQNPRGASQLPKAVLITKLGITVYSRRSKRTSDSLWSQRDHSGESGFVPFTGNVAVLVGLLRTRAQIWFLGV